ncbi:MAG TPA: class I SAM-dependent rRNA methyltransferase [Verrucomicrobiota bacterium]|nr:class I SAM-dependent rRNA methyltransferase [Verrucomicrobiota bacterium]HRR65470.1 class I SAM-dependent rRNA methyltransferase [Candidatus Paceibacterota bacterium]HNS70321.1 class I SAM-dependent rRNA methyltransferase [Verrucomicrobiota bacterium]HOM45850.1 class I SAM-dependent rRNA methyltransferase [Verrucomicrobiota bacterium]HOQ56242.1 class I SAM-dependent rRNA methyltransferase [Verrucomicrobiota bacterium]
MQSLPTVILKPGEADRIVAGHPWIYQSSVIRLTRSAPEGALVQVKDHRQRFLGTGFYHPQSKIAVRMLASDRIEVNQAFFEERIRAALAVRQKHLPGATSFRAVNAESDFLSGLVIDKYEDVLVIQISSLGMEQRKPLIVAALTAIFSPRAIVERGDAIARKFEGLPEAHGVLAGLLAGPVPIKLNGLQFEADVLAGHKTGLYLDQQDNYPRVARWAKGAQVLDCFSFLGGFGLHAARAGAAHVHLLEQSAEAVAAATRHAAANGLAELCSFETVNAFDWLKAQTTRSPHEQVIPRWDLIVLDPPSFTRNRASVPDALRGYKEIHLRALKLIKTGGTLATFCCSHHVNSSLFQDTVLSAAFDARRILRRIAVYSQSPDHPIIPMIPETEYLKGFAFEVVR